MRRAGLYVFLGMPDLDSDIPNAPTVDRVGSKALIEGTQPLVRIGVRLDVYGQPVRVLAGIVHERARSYLEAVIHPGLFQNRSQDDRLAAQVHNEQDGPHLHLTVLIHPNQILSEAIAREGFIYGTTITLATVNVATV